MLSFPDASGSAPVKSGRAELSSPLASGFLPLRAGRRPARGPTCARVSRRGGKQEIRARELHNRRRNPGGGSCAAAGDEPHGRRRERSGAAAGVWQPRGVSERRRASELLRRQDLPFSARASPAAPEPEVREEIRAIRPEKLDPIFFLPSL